jgi:uracil-DNA glycosylase
MALDQYLTTNVLSSDFVCPHYRECKSSHAETFYEGQLHHVGRFYDLLLDDLPYRIVVVGQEYGHEPPRVNRLERYKKIMEIGRDRRFKAEGDYKARNPHMKGTTNVLRLLFGIPLGSDHDSEFIPINGEHVHLFDAFALVNYLLCSAVPTGGRMRGKATRTMMKNCQGHFREVIRILEPSVVIVQGKAFLDWVSPAFGLLRPEADHVFSATLGTTKTFVAAFTHPSAHFPDNWGANDRTAYLLETVAPSIAFIRQQMRRVL